MPHKTQDQCYRMINGERYDNMCDVIGSMEHSWLEAAKRINVPRRVVRHKDGFQILFVPKRHWDDVMKAAAPTKP